MDDRDRKIDAQLELEALSTLIERTTTGEQAERVPAFCRTSGRAAYIAPYSITCELPATVPQYSQKSGFPGLFVPPFRRTTGKISLAGGETAADAFRSVSTWRRG